MCGSVSKIPLSLNAPGSPSSQLHNTYLESDWAGAKKLHLTPVGNAAPPLPLNPEFLTWFTISSGVFKLSALSKASYPPLAIYWSISEGSMLPKFLVMNKEKYKDWFDFLND